MIHRKISLELFNSIDTLCSKPPSSIVVTIFFFFLIKKIHRRIKYRKLTFVGTNACHEASIEMIIMLKEKGVDLPEAFFFFPFESQHHLCKNIVRKKDEKPTLDYSNRDHFPVN